jgi:hypothetical protein
VPLEGVVNALRRIHAALVPNGLLVDTQPVSANPPVFCGDRSLGMLDMREWAATIDAVDRRTADAVAAGLYQLEHERSVTVIDVYDDGRELLDEVREWAGTRIPPALERAVSDVAVAVDLRQEIRLRVYRAERTHGR